MPSHGIDGFERLRGSAGRTKAPPRPPACTLVVGIGCRAQSRNTGARLAMLAVIASVRSWLISMAAFQVAM